VRACELLDVVAVTAAPDFELFETFKALLIRNIKDEPSFDAKAAVRSSAVLRLIFMAITVPSCSPWRPWAGSASC